MKREIPGYGTVVQDPLTFFEKNDLLALVAEALDTALAQGMNMQALMASFDVPDDIREKLKQGEVSPELLRAWGSLGRDLLRLFGMVPDLMMDLYLLALSVPAADRDQARLGLHSIDDDTGFGIMETFIEQNGSTLVDFFARWSKQLQGVSSLIPNQESSPT